MKGNRNPPPPPSGTVPLSPTSKGTAKYTNKDGSKFITVPKMNTPIDSAQPSPTTASSPTAKTAAHPAPGAEPAQPVNRKKQKRRAKAAAKAAAEQAQAGPTVNGIPSPPRTNDQQSADADPEDDEEEPIAGRDSEHQPPYQNGVAQDASGKSKKSKKKKKKNTTGPSADESPNDIQYVQQDAHRHSPAPVPPPPPPLHERPGMTREKIWNTNSQEERERIKEFWLGLSETERKSLVKVEKDAVLRKMKEQQKHTCSCTVCGRKRTAIEEELEGLYDAYYEELEQYANHPNQGEGPPMLRPRRSFGSMGGMRPRGLHSRFSNHQPSRGRIIDDLGDEEEEEDDAEVEDEGDGEEEGEDVYSEEELEDDMYSEEEQEPSEELHRSDYAADFFNFGNSLTVQGRDRLPILPSFLQSYPFSGAGNNAYGSSSLGGILTVADDLLKNDGKKFIEMMEQLAERRMAREEDARGQFDRGYDHANGDRYGHSHPPPPPEEEEFEDEEEEYEEDDEEEYDSQEEEDTMTEEQRMEEGRRMFQIFAARMFEQRVLTAYREKVAKERQAKLLEEIEAENQQDAERKAKKAKDAQRRKDRAAKKKEAQAEEKARKEAEKAAEETARRAEEAQKAEEQRAKAEEKRKKREAQRKADEEERQRKEAERLRKIQEREENERKAREAKEREKKAREEARSKEKEARELKEREARERREQQERERREKEAKAKAEREAREGKDTKEKRKREERAAQKAAALAAAVPVPVTLPKRPAPQQPAAPPVAAVPVLPQQAPTSYASPQITVATPAFPKAPTPMRARQPSQQESSTASSGAASHSGSAASQNPSPHPLTPVHASPGPIGPPGKSGAAGASSQSGLPLSGPPFSGPQPPSHSASPMSFPVKALPPQHGPFGIPPMSFPPGLPHIPPGFGNPVHRDPLFPSIPGFRPAPGMMPMPPGFGGPVGNRGFPMHPPPGFHGPMESPVPSMAQLISPIMQKGSPASHSRQGSGSFDAGASQPISRPTPIGRPASVVQGQRPSSGSPSGGLPRPEPDARLGSRALLDDLDDGLQDFSGRMSRGGSAPGPRPVPAFPMGPFGMDPIFPPHNPWGPPGVLQPNPFGPLPPPGFGPSPLSGHGPMSMPWGHPMPPASTFGGPGVVDRPIEPHSVAVRKMLRRACEDLADVESKKAEGKAEASDIFIPLEGIKTHVEMFNHGYPIDEKELLDICETEGNEVNGGGSFDVRDDDQGRKSIRFVSGNERPTPQPVQKAVGYHPGSPVGGGGNGPIGGSGGNAVGGSR
ncbi:salt tolerance down-regulator-domain-containing protein [Chaetomidium leptoderma]|uniref:Stress response protein NST1 n=1 Tax=Chaetomidium leptoderma TaxID=669021 RepID=A0AAN6VI98_9PEZI|nr:salt tolerance down-regulator-domain-containing protein [Chaetomidium leptoderma]